MAGTELQAAIYTKLTGTTAVSDLVDGRIYDDVPDNLDSFPYVTVGDDTLTRWDTDDSNGFEAILNIHVWSRYRGRKETKEIQKAIYDALHNTTLVVSGYDTIVIQQQSALTLLDPDGKTRHGVQALKVLIDEE